MTFEAYPFFYILLVGGIIFTVTAILTLMYPPKTINYIYGYRTKRSRQSPEAWKFAQRYSSRIMLGGGVMLCIFSLLSLAIDPFPFAWQIGISIGLIMLLSFGMLIKTERELKKRFG